MRACRCVRSRGRSCGCATPPGPGLLERVVRFEGGYLVPRGDGRYVLGATVEERGFEERPTAGGVYELLRDARELVPGVLELQIEELSVGFRPATPDNTPVIGAGAVEGLVWATGHHRNGILLGAPHRRARRGGIGGGGGVISSMGRAPTCRPARPSPARLVGSDWPSMRAAWRWPSTARSFRALPGRPSRSPRTPAWRCSPRCREDDGWAMSAMRSTSPDQPAADSGTPMAAPAAGRVNDATASEVFVCRLPAH